MAAAVAYEPAKGERLLMEHFAVLELVTAGKPTARARLDRAIGADLAALLVFALVTPDQRRSARGGR